MAVLERHLLRQRATPRDPEHVEPLVSELLHQVGHEQREHREVVRMSGIG
jgi:hypothetical protein